MRAAAEIEPMLLRAPEVARRLGITLKTLHEHVRAGEIVYIPLGKGQKRPRLAFTPADVQDFIEQRRRRSACPSTNTKTARTISTTSKSAGRGFMALRARLIAEKQKT